MLRLDTNSSLLWYANGVHCKTSPSCSAPKSEDCEPSTLSSQRARWKSYWLRLHFISQAVKRWYHFRATPSQTCDTGNQIAASNCVFSPPRSCFSFSDLSQVPSASPPPCHIDSFIASSPQRSYPTQRMRGWLDWTRYPPRCHCCAEESGGNDGRAGGWDRRSCQVLNWFPFI